MCSRILYSCALYGVKEISLSYLKPQESRSEQVKSIFSNDSSGNFPIGNFINNVLSLSKSTNIAYLCEKGSVRNS